MSLTESGQTFVAVENLDAEALATLERIRQRLAPNRAASFRRLKNGRRPKTKPVPIYNPANRD